MNDDASAAKTITGRKVAYGIVVGIAAHSFLVFVIPIMWILSALGFKSDDWVIVAVFNPGLTQFLYNGLIALYFRRRGEAGKFRGVLIAMGLTILVNGLCWAALETGKFR